jgi:hypothetical protein
VVVVVWGVGVGWGRGGGGCYAIQAPWSCVIAFWAFCTGLLCGTLRRLLHIGEGSLGGIGNTAPSSSDVIPMVSKRFALQGIEYAFL